MDEDALRAMMPMSFGKKKGSIRKQQPPLPPAASAASTSLSDNVLGKRRASEDGSEAKHGTEKDKAAERIGREEEEEDDGLTAEERAANAEAERKERERRAAGIESDSDDDTSNPNSDDDGDDDDDDDDDEVGPPLPPPTTTQARRKDLILPPTTHNELFSGHHQANKTLSALAVDPAGSRFALGSYDYGLSLYDFGGLSSRSGASYAPFRMFEPAGSYPVLDLSFSPDGSNLLVVSGTASAKVFSRDGGEVGECRKGDPYLRDMRRTEGHVGSLACGLFHPGNKGKFLTGGSDSTVRIWDLSSLTRGQEDLIVLKSRTRGNRTKVTALDVTKEGLVFAPALDGSLAYWDLRTNLNSKPRGSVESAHAGETVTSGIAAHETARKVVSRGGDGTVKLWDLRMFSKAVAVKGGLTNGSGHTSVLWSPLDGGRTVVTGVSALPSNSENANGNGGGVVNDEDDQSTLTNIAGGAVGGSIVTLDITDLSIVDRYPTPSVPIRLHWASSTDQLFSTFRDGSARIFYDPGRSTKGIVMALSRATRLRDTSFYTSASSSGGYEDSYPIFEGNTTTLASEGGLSESAKRRKLIKARKDPLATKMPQPPIEGQGKGGRLGAGAMTHVTQNLYKDKKETHDPREALLKYAQADGEESIYGKAWEKTQPKTLFSKYDEEEEKN